jgi:glutaconate CoA-transferase, subunit A
VTIASTRQGRDKRCDAAAALAAVADGATVGMGGILDRRRPHHLATQLAASGRRDLHVVSFLAGLETEVLAAAGAISRLTTAYVDPRADAAATERALASGVIRLDEVSELVFVGGLRAAANGLPFWPTKGATGSDIAGRLGLRDVVCPYTGVSVLAVPALPLDIALLHVEAATADGRILAPSEREFLDDADVVLARAARRVVIETERIAGPDEGVGDRPVSLAPFEIDAVVEVAPG